MEKIQSNDDKSSFTKNFDIAINDNLLTDDERDILISNFEEEKYLLDVEKIYNKIQQLSYISSLQAIELEKVLTQELKKQININPMIVKQHGKLLEYASEELQNDREVVLAAVKQLGKMLIYASEELQNDREIVLAAIKNDPFIFQRINKKFKGDREIVFNAIKHVGDLLEFASEEIKNDREVVLAAVQQSGRALLSASEEIKNNREIIFGLIKQDPYVFEFINEKFKNDKEIVFAAVQYSGMMLKYVSQELRQNRELMFDLIKNNGLLLYYLPEAFKNDREIVFAAIKKDGRLLEYASEELKNNREFVLTAIKQDGRFLEYASEQLKNDRELVLTAIKSNGFAITFVNSDLFKNKEFIDECFKMSWSASMILKEKGLLSKEQTAKVEEYQNKLGRIGITEVSLLRFQGDFLFIDDIIKNRNLDTLLHDTRPTVLVFYPTHDHNKAFIHNDFISLYKQGYRLIYYEVDNEDIIYNSIKEVGTFKKIDTIIFGGHGDRTTIAYAGEDLGVSKKELLQENEAKYIDLSDKNDFLRRNLSQFVKTGSIIILESCSTGESGKTGNNMANMMSKIFPYSIVNSPTVPAPTGSFVFDEFGKLIGSRYRGLSKEKHYIISHNEEKG